MIAWWTHREQIHTHTDSSTLPLVQGSKQNRTSPWKCSKYPSPPQHYSHSDSWTRTTHSAPHSITIKVPTPNLTSQPMRSALWSDLQPMIDIQSNSKPRLSFLFIFIFRKHVSCFSRVLLSTVRPSNLQLSRTNFTFKNSRIRRGKTITIRPTIFIVILV